MVVRPQDTIVTFLKAHHRSPTCAVLMSNNEALNEEIEATASIYNTEVLSITSSADQNSDTIIAVLTLPNSEYSFTLTFPPTYPDEPPSITGTHHVSATAKIGEGDSAANILRTVLGQIYTPGYVCLFDLIEEATPLLQAHHEAQQPQDGPTQDPEEYTGSTSWATRSDNTNTSVSDATTIDWSLVPSADWIISDSLVVNKSTFVARCMPIPDLSTATSSITHLLSTNKKVAAATHNITAWRIKSLPQQTKGDNQPEIVIQDSDDDGETAAGGRLLHLMQLMDVWNVVVVVSRWYGGVKLGPDRFRCINAVAREVLVKGGFGKEETPKGGKKGKK